MEVVAGIFAILLFSSPFVLLIVFLLRYQKRMLARAWENTLLLFREYGIEPVSEIPADKRVMLNLTGRKNNRNVRVYSEYIGIGKSKQLVTRIIMETPYSLNFELSRENVFTKAGEAIGIHDIKTGNAEFDKSFRLHSLYPGETVKLFNDAILSEFVAVKKEFTGKLELKNNLLTHTMNVTPGQKLGFRYFRNGFHLVLQFGNAGFRNNSGAHSPNGDK